MAANKERGELSLRAGKKTYILKLTTNSVCQMETASGLTFDQVISKMQVGSMNDVRLFLWAMLLAHCPALTVEEAGDIIDAAGGLLGVQMQLEALVSLNTKEASSNGSSKANPPKAQPGTGAVSILTPGASA